MDAGSTMAVMAKRGSQTFPEVSGPIPLMEVGYIRITDGPGIPDITGVGLLSITDAGLLTTATDGFGSPEMYGPLPGWRGDSLLPIMGGLLSDRA